MRFQFNRQQMLDFNITTADVLILLNNYIFAAENDHYRIKKREARDLLRGFRDIKILSSSDYGKDSILYLCFGIEQDPLDYQWLIQKKNQLIEKVKLEGYENIKDVEVLIGLT